MLTIAIANRKGGVGKTTTAMNLVATLDASGKRVALVDLDPQASATLISLGGQHSRDGGEHLLSALCGNRKLERCARRIRYLDQAVVLSSGPALGEAQARLQDRPAGGQTALRKALLAAKERGFVPDVVIVDTPPGNPFLIHNALVAASAVIVPSPLERLAMDGLAALTETVAEIREELNPELRLAGILQTRVSTSRALTHSLSDELSEVLPNAVLDAYIREDAAVSASDNRYRPVARARKAARAAEDYRAATDEVMRRLSFSVAC